MARIEELSGYLDGRAPDGGVLLRTADVVVGTPVAGFALDDAEFDALIAVGDVRDADFLVGAVRTRRWVLVGAPGARPPAHREYANEEPADHLARGPLGRAVDAGAATDVPSGDAPEPDDSTAADPRDTTFADPTITDVPPDEPTTADPTITDAAPDEPTTADPTITDAAPDDAASETPSPSDEPPAPDEPTR
ncbi:hypothetical protein BJF79_20100 [Actinomadura sp. CNU-125]|uniref:hypothetical protein n=1 Tax=Actinomadura sp. CNU-125 TaxID=1904961 RepID=UPI00095B50E7|nr:hypothetical protein [Actinomadura sp. CNU-125]OLT13687.1 hypothetical protein BJF79_20100 [Actinomadura sp. CNU-125]